MLESQSMTKLYRPGVDARRAILLELRRRELAGKPAPSAVALAADFGVPRSTLQRHVATLARWGWVTTRAGRAGCILLTEEGRSAAV